MHKLDDKTLITPKLLQRLRAEGEFEGADGKHVAFLQKNDGSFLRHQYACKAGMLERLFAEDMLNALNREIPHDGAWFIVYSRFEPPKPPMLEGIFHRFCLMWMDKDGDTKFSIECDRPLHAVMGDTSVYDWMDKCEAGWELRQWSDRVLDARPDQQYREALGEKAPSVH